MIRGRNLGEGFGLGAVGLVAAGADDCGVELRRRHGCGIVGMLGLGSVAGLARDHYMLALLFLIDHVGVAGLTRLMAGEGDGSSGRLGDGSATIVSVLAKAAWNDCGAQDDKGNHCDRDDRGEPDEVFNVLEQAILPAPESGATCAQKMANDLGYLGFVRGTMIEVTRACDRGH